MAGWELVLLGWATLFVPNVGWIANFAYGASLIVMLVGLRRVSIGLALLAVVLGLQSLMLFGVTLDADEAGARHMLLSHLGPGFYLWMSAMAVVVPGAFWAASGGRSAGSTTGH